MALPATGYDYEATALADGLVAYYPMYDKYELNTVADIIGGRDLNVINDANDNTLVTGINGLCRDLTANGTGTLHSMLHRGADASDLTTYSDWTIGIWFNLDALVTVNNPTVLDLTSDRGLKVYFDFPGSVDTLYITFSDAASIFSTTSMPALATNHLLLVTCDSATTTITAYLDNVQIGTDAAATQVLAPWSGQMFIGDSSILDSSAAYLDGLVDEKFIFDRAINSTERGYIWNLGTPISLIQHANAERAIVEDTIGFNDFSAYSFAVVANDIIGMNSTAVAVHTVIAQAADDIGMNSVAIGTLRSPGDASDTIGFSESVLGGLRASATANDTLSFIAGLTVDGETYTGIVMNTENAAVSEYDNFSFNSLTRAGTGRYLGAKADGIYELGGDLDDTSEIDAYFTTKLFDFESDKFKRMDRAYLGIKNDGSMILKTITRDSTDGKKHENWYELEATSEEMRTQRIKTGRGLKSHYWQFTVTNKLGSDFDLDTIEFKPIILSRRV